MAEGNLGAVDYVVFSLVLVCSASIGVYFRFTGGRQKTMKEYLLADGDMPLIPVSFSLVVSFMSAITTLGLSSEIYSFGIMYMMNNVGNIFGTLVLAYGFLPVFFNQQATSAYQYLELRFGALTRTACSLAYFIQMLMYTSVVLYAPSLALAAVTGLSLAGCVLSVGLVCIFYSVLGGMKAILITDAFQAGIILVSVICIIVKGSVDEGGSKRIWNLALEGGRIDFFNFSFDPTVRHTTWGLVIGGTFNYLSAYVNQTQVQRLKTVSTLRRSQYAVLLSLPILVVLNCLTGATGVISFARYFDCDPLREGRIDKYDQILPIYVMDSLSSIPGLAGLFIAGIFSAALSTISSTLNSLAAVTIEDYIKPALRLSGRQEPTDSRASIYSQLIALLYGLLCIGLAFLVGGLSGMLQLVLTIFGVVGGPVLAVFTLGMFTWGAEQVGAVSGLMCGLAMSLWVGFGGPKPPLPYLPTRVDGCETTETSLLFNTTSTLDLQSSDSEDYFWLYRVSYMWYGVIGFVVTLVTGFSVSLARSFIWSRDQPGKLDPGLFSPVIKRFLPKDRMISETIAEENIQTDFEQRH